MKINLKESLYLYAYRGLTLFISLILCPVFLCHSRGKRRLRERYGFWRLPAGNYIWFHGASVGEVNGLLPIIKAVKSKHTDLKILLTASSPTGLDRGEAMVDEIRLLPFDVSWYLQRACKEVQIERFIFGETEIWPELLRYVKSTGAKIHMVNATVSDYTFPWYSRAKTLFSPALRLVDSFCVAQEHYLDRFVSLGVDQDLLMLTKNTKYDITPELQDSSELNQFKSSFFENSLPVIVLASLWPGEEKFWLPYLNAMSSKFQFNLILAPRHQEKFNYFAETLEQSGISFDRRTEASDRSAKTILLDTYGELVKVYAFADLVYIGGSLLPGIGGHNPLEAAMYSVPIGMGQYYDNIREPMAELQQKDAIRILSTKEDVEKLLDDFFSAAESLKKMGIAAKQVSDSYRGVTDKVIDIIFS